MSNDPYSPSWYRVAELRPRLRGHVRIHRHHYRGERWYVLEDRVSRRMHRFNPVAYYAIGLMDGRRTLQQIWESALGRFGDDAPTQDEMIRLLGQLHAADVLQADVTPDVAELLRRAKRATKSVWRQNLLSPLAVRIPLFDPERLLERWLPWYRPLFGWGGALLWCLVVGSAILGVAQHWPELSRDFTDRVLAPQNLFLMWLTFPLLKLCHEFGHACATRAWGGEVHEMGVMFLVLMPIPYVDASAATAFPEMRRRAVVGAAGMLVELFIASVALFLWLEAQPGIARAVLYNVMLIAGVSTVFFNANPLLRYDGYYILCDLLQIPNLRNRANQYLAYLVEGRLFGVKVAAPEASDGEKVWFVLFAITSFAYRTFIMLAIAVFIASRYMIIGVLLALWALVASFVWPILRGLGYLFLHSRVRHRRVRALAVTTAVAGGLAVLLFVMPLPLWVNAEGVIDVPEDARVRAGADGFVRQVVVQPGEVAPRGAPLVAADDFELGPRIRVLEAQLRLLRVRAHAELQDDRVRWQITQEEIRATQAELAHAREQQAALTVRSPASGEFVLAAARTCPSASCARARTSATWSRRGARRRACSFPRTTSISCAAGPRAFASSWPAGSTRPSRRASGAKCPRRATGWRTSPCRASAVARRPWIRRIRSAPRRSAPGSSSSSTCRRRAPSCWASTPMRASSSARSRSAGAPTASCGSCSSSASRSDGRRPCCAQRLSGAGRAARGTARAAPCRSALLRRRRGCTGRKAATHRPAQRRSRASRATSHEST
jgi:putative peptide zinc metalloprotease protein